MPSPRMLHAAIRRLRLLALLIATALASAGSVQGDTIVMQASEDTAPYSFLPSLPRHTSPTLCLPLLDEQNVEHDFETYLWFDVAEEDLPPGHVLVQALLVNTYAFDFTGFGDPRPIPARSSAARSSSPGPRRVSPGATGPSTTPPSIRSRHHGLRRDDL
ncbi:MAG: hypothetical protein R3E53_10875 [Myxococcota bacterium]